jgi:hypothetical protein
MHVTLLENLDSFSIETLHTTSDLALRKESTFRQRDECYFRHLFRKHENKTVMDTSVQKYIERIEHYAPMVLYMALNRLEKQPGVDQLILDDHFFTQFYVLEIIDVSDITIGHFKVSNTTMNCLNNLFYVSLLNNALSTIDMDFQSTDKLVSLKLYRNSLSTLTINCLLLKSL